MSVLPIVSPAHNADGIALQPVITALYPFALEEGSVSTENVFLVKKVSTISSNQTIPVPIRINLKRIELTSNNEYTSPVYLPNGNLYRSLIEITPVSQLEAHSEYSVILSRDLSKKSVFDVEPLETNTGTKIPLAKGPSTLSFDRHYRIDVVIGGSESTARFNVVTIGSPGPTYEDLVAKKRFIEVANGLFLKFETGTYVAGDKFVIRTKPAVKTNEIYSWDFKTGDGNYVKPSDKNSNVIIDLPVNNPNAPSNPNAPFRLVSVTPALNSVMNNPANKLVTFTFNKDIDPASVTAESIKIIAESTASLYYGPIDFTHEIQGNKLIITFQ